MRRRSLFWTFAGTFLIVLIAATIIQMGVIATVLNPLAALGLRDAAERGVASAAATLAAAPTPPGDDEIAALLGANHFHRGPVMLVFLRADGALVPGHPLPPGIATTLRGLLVRPAGVARDIASRPLPPADTGTPPEPRGIRFEVLARRTIVWEGNPVGELAAIGPVRRAAIWALPEAHALLLFLPFGVVAAAVAGLIMVRFVVRRLRALEIFAHRVASGDLEARVAVRQLDEIGRLEERFNRMTEALATARGALEENDRQRRRLFTDITHELATPLTSIRGCLETVLDPGVPMTTAERTAYVRDALESAECLGVLTGDLFDLARLESGVQSLHPVRLDWSALCRNATRRFQERFRGAGLELAWMSGDCEAWILADGRRIEQVVDNLLTNALRYVPAGGRVWVSLTPANGANPRHRLEIADNGPGISAEDLPHVFERFFRANDHSDPVGSGLGLAIVKEIVGRHGGGVSAHRPDPAGVVFGIELPVAGAGSLRAGHPV